MLYMESNKININNTYKNSYNLKPLLRRYYSTSVKPSIAEPMPNLTITNLQDKSQISSKRSLLSNKAGIYSFVNKVNRKQYIGSAKDLYLRLNEHLSALLEIFNEQRTLKINSLGKNTLYFFHP